MAEAIALALYGIGIMTVLAVSADDPRIRDNEGILAACAVGWPIFALIIIAARIAGRRHG
jgi:threonine/homoserine efflux transporter RhtA